MPVPLDEYPLHQAPLSMQHVTTSDRNAYDRCYFNAHDRTGDLFLITGLGVYPNLGVIDAYATLRTGDRQVAVRMSDALGDDRLDQQVGPYRIEVIEPLREDPADLRGRGARASRSTSPGTARSPRSRSRATSGAGTAGITLDACRFAQVGTWTGEIEVEGEKIAVTPDTWLGTRDRSWGIRPVGEPEPAGPQRATSRSRASGGSYVPLRFDDYAIVIILQEEPDGHRVMNEAVRVWPDVDRALARAARLARDRHPLPVGLAPPGARDDHADRAGRQAADARGRDARVRRAQLGPGLRRRPELEPRRSGRAAAGSRARSTT